MVEWPTGCVPWFRDLRLIDNHKAFHVPDVNSMTDGSLFMGATTETWYVNGRCRFLCASSAPRKASRCQPRAMFNSAVVSIKLFVFRCPGLFAM